ncbi:MAG: phosphoribosylformylglycinamidine cyclo-ligase [Clostridiales Family XIII bacterium]|jgi:phosphoribosylformylglycinamidine cyclo-ligase|nr:phosphoribosylformylglycinamidine cyclo-ligase [Clostridiales Family XIII bacterium]
MGEGISYRDAGVDTKEGGRAVSLMREHVQRTFTPGALTGLGGFGGLFRLDAGDMREPVLVAGADGVGTKLKIAFIMDRHDTVGIDCVAMCVNDILCQGAKPLFFLDYIATGRLEAEKIADIVKGLADGCVMAGCALIGGETAEMPGFYAEGEYDMAGFAVGVAEREGIIDGSGIKAGDALIGLASSGLHSNGFSLVREVLFRRLGMCVDDFVDELGAELGETLLTPTRIYAEACGAVLPGAAIKGMAHITGGGFFENLPRMLPDGLGAAIRRGSWDIPPVFGYIRERGGVDEDEMYATFNMGVGLVMAVSPGDAEKVMGLLSDAGESACIIGEAVRGEGVKLC